MGEEAGAALSSHPGIDFISFTGSPEVSTLIQIAASRNHIDCTLELGGMSPHMVFGDLDWWKSEPTIRVWVRWQTGSISCWPGRRRWHDVSQIRTTITKHD